MPPNGPRYYYLGPWVEGANDRGETAWGLPEHTVGAVILSPVGTISPYGFIATDTPLDDPAYMPFGETLGATMDVQQVSAWSAYTGVPVPEGSYTLLDLLWNTLTVWADPEGISTAAPLLPNQAGELQLWLQGHSLVRAESATTAHPAWPKIRDRVRASYRSMRNWAEQAASQIERVSAADVQRGGRATEEQEAIETLRNLTRRGRSLQDAKAEAATRLRDQAQKWLGFTARKYARLGVTDWRELVPEDLRDREPAKPETTYVDNFNRANGPVGTASGGWDWVIHTADTATVSSNRGVFSVSGANLNVRPPHLSGDDHYIQVDMINGAGNEPALIVRGNNTAGYHFINRGGWGWWRWSGSWIQIGVNASPQPSNGNTVYAGVEANTLTAKQNGTNVCVTTDTALSWGVQVRIGNWTASWTLDNLVAADLAATETIEESITFNSQPGISTAKIFDMGKNTVFNADLSDQPGQYMSTNQAMVMDANVFLDAIKAMSLNKGLSLDPTISESFLKESGFTRGITFQSNLSKSLSKEIVSQKQTVFGIITDYQISKSFETFLNVLYSTANSLQTTKDAEISQTIPFGMDLTFISNIDNAIDLAVLFDASLDDVYNQSAAVIAGISLNVLPDLANQKEITKELLTQLSCEIVAEAVKQFAAVKNVSYNIIKSITVSPTVVSVTFELSNKRTVTVNLFPRVESVKRHTRFTDA